MSFVDKLRNKSEEVKTTQLAVVNEITKLFQDYLDNDFENFLEKHISEDNIKERNKILTMEFWRYVSGCSGTHFYMAGFWFRNKDVDEYSYDANYYKGVKLSDIQEDVIDTCIELLYLKLKEMGFSFGLTKHKMHPVLDVLQCEVELRW